DLNMVENAGKVGAYLRRAMADAVGDHPNVGEIRGEGMLCAVELTSDRSTRGSFSPVGSVAGKVVGEMVKRGVISRAMPQGDILGFAPPLCLTEGEADQIARVTAETLR
ncbi:aminotransferase class III-fold pyridoxal phosphate-dependent enzyme, partial [Bacillus sp. NTK074B]|nr:aminotransferase class III-fold pyridoxal phosphate-dependent enzyme [Bacillus sp. NTK074B]